MTSYRLCSLELLTNHLGQHRDLWQAHGRQDWEKIEPATPLPLQAGCPAQSAKQFFFAEQEHVFVFDGHCFRETLPEPAPFALLGLSSCDLVAIGYQDAFFAEDPYYQTRRKQALLVGLECTQPCESGFCPSVDAGPEARPGTADLVLHPLDTGWLLTVASDKGAEALAGLALPQAAPKDLQQREHQLSICKQQFPGDHDIIEGIRRLNAGEVTRQLWQQMGIQCLACSGCTSLCPTCSCYGVQDQPCEEGFTRRRFWDSCLYDGFQREASQHNPSAEAGDRVHRFWYHKFSDTFRTEFGRYGCVGCGRCQTTCPGVIGVHSVMKRIAHE